MLLKGRTIDRGHATVTENGGVDYREIADIMTELGYSMNHSSARNHVLRIMKKFAEAIVIDYAPTAISIVDDIARSPSFQDGIADLLHTVEAERRLCQSIPIDQSDLASTGSEREVT